MANVAKMDLVKQNNCHGNNVWTHSSPTEMCLEDPKKK